MRQSIDLTSLRRGLYPNMVNCNVCNHNLVPVETKSNTVVWYCSNCDLYNECTSTGTFLRSFKKTETGRG